jgi:hypothetical protein
MEVAIVGCGPTYKEAPFRGDGVTTWGVNDAVSNRAVDVVFWMDRKWFKGTDRDKKIRASVLEIGVPMYSTQVWDDIPTSVAYPKGDLVDFFGIDYFADSVSMMTALAIYQGYTTISYYGCDYAWGQNYVNERPGVEFWQGIALALGVTINVNGEMSDLLVCTHPKAPRGHIYAYRTPQRKRGRIKMGGVRNIEEKEYALSVQDRVALIQLLPSRGNFETLNASQNIGNLLIFNMEDRKKLNMIVLKPEDGSQPIYKWDDNDIPDKTVSLNAIEQRVVINILQDLDKNGRLGHEHFELYKKFVLENK